MKETRVRVISLGIKGSIFHIDWPSFRIPYFNPIQVELDHPYDDTGQRMYRTSFEDIVFVKEPTWSLRKKSILRKKPILRRGKNENQ